MPTSASGAHLANSNGKRPHGSLSNGADEDEAVETMPNAGRSNAPAQTHASSGYRWTRAEDEPGYSWTNKKAFDEMGRAWEVLAHRDVVVKGMALGCPELRVRSALLTIDATQAATAIHSRLRRGRLRCLRA
jgi:hypothetical protein